MRKQRLKSRKQQKHLSVHKPAKPIIRGSQVNGNQIIVTKSETLLFSSLTTRLGISKKSI